MNLSRWSILHPIPVLMLFIVLTITGLYAFKQLNIQNMPDAELGVVSVSVIYPGATAETMETHVLNPLERSLSGVQGIKHIHGIAASGAASVTIEFNLETNMLSALESVRSAVTSVRNDMPADIEEPNIQKVDFSSMVMLTYAFESEKLSNEALSFLIDDVLIQRFATIKGLGKINRVGGTEREIHIILDPLKLQAMGLNAATVSRQLAAMYGDKIAGQTELGSLTQTLRVQAAVENLADVGQIMIPLPMQGAVRLTDLGRVEDTVSDHEKGAYLNGRPVVGLEFSQSLGSDQTFVQHEIARVIRQIEADYPDLTITKVIDFAEIARDEFSGSMRLLYEGAFLTMLIVWLFLRDARATFVAATALPLSLIPTFAGMYYLDFSLNVVTLIALSLVIGVLVDDAIVEVENIERHLHMGKTPYQAAMDAATEIGLAVISTTLTLVAVFAPTAFMDGVVGLFFRQFGLTASISVLASLLVARMFTPMIAAYFLKEPQKTYQEPAWLGVYMRLSRFCLQHRFLTVASGGAFFIFSLMMIPFLPQGFMPMDNNTYTQVSLNLPPAASYREMLPLVREVEHRLSQKDYVNLLYSTIGDGHSGSNPFAPKGSANASHAVISVALVDRGHRGTKADIHADMVQTLADLPGVQVSVGLDQANDKYKLALIGDNNEELLATARTIERELHTMQGIGDVKNTSNLEQMEVVAHVDFAQAAQLGVTSAEIADALRIATAGDFSVYLPKITYGKRQIPMVVRFDRQARQNLKDLENLLISTMDGRKIRIGDVATLRLAGAPVHISHYDQKRSVLFTIALGDMPMGEFQKKFFDLPSMKNLPVSVRPAPIAEAESMKELVSGFTIAILTGVLAIYVVLVLLFKDFLQPVTLLTALPLSLGGSFFMLLMTQNSLSMPAFIGLIMLMGIATKNSILLVEYTLVSYRERGMPRLEAVLDACHKRARPIIMTSLAMSAGMLPIALGFGSHDMSFRSPMAITVIGGLISSTFLSLLIIPALFTYMDDFENWLKRHFRP